jgi:hypothetical protein
MVMAAWLTASGVVVDGAAGAAVVRSGATVPELTGPALVAVVTAGGHHVTEGGCERLVAMTGVCFGFSTMARASRCSMP